MTQSQSQNFEGQHVYVAPESVVYDIISEGVLCTSLDRADTGYDNDHFLGEI